MRFKCGSTLCLGSHEPFHFLLVFQSVLPCSIHVGGPWTSILGPLATPWTNVHSIDHFFSVLPYNRGAKRQIVSSASLDSRSVWAKGNISTS
jgi:hypothetical protein